MAKKSKGAAKRLHVYLPQDVVDFLETRQAELGSSYGHTLALAARAFISVQAAEVQGRDDLRERALRVMAEVIHASPAKIEAAFKVLHPEAEAIEAANRRRAAGKGAA